MTLDQLRTQLGELDLPGETLIVMSKDAEGNGYSPLANLDRCMYEAETTWFGDILDEDEEDQASDTAVPSIVLWPTV